MNKRSISALGSMAQDLTLKASILDDVHLGYPRVCAHRGFNTIAPENSLPAFGAAIALGAEEIEFDLWPSKDGEIVSCHDPHLDRVSTGSGRITERTLKELRALDFGVKFSEVFSGLTILTFEEILQKFAGQTIMNVHIKPLSFQEPYPKESMEKIVALVRAYHAENYVYFMLETDEQLAQFKAYAKDIAVCVGHLQSRPWEIVERAIEFGCEKVQIFRDYFKPEMIEKAHAHGIICNMFGTDDPKEAAGFVALGIDTVLTNDYLRVSAAVKR